MTFAQQLVSYYQGEWLEAVLLTVFGMVTGGLAAAMWQHAGENALLKGLFYPIAFLATFTLLAGGFGIYNNNQRLSLLPQRYAQSPADFVQAERNRFEGAKGVNTWWMPLKLLWTALIVIGMVVSFMTRDTFINGVAIGLVCIGSMGFVIDGFAHQRAKLYTAALMGQGSSPR